MHSRPIHLAVALGLCISWLGTAAPAIADKGWKLEQAGDYLGPMTCYVGKKSIKMVLKRYGINFCLSSTDYKVIGYNDKTKTYFSEDYATWKERFLSSRLDINKAESVQQGTTTVANIKVKRILVQSVRGGQPARAPIVNGRSYNTEMFVTDDIKTLPQFISLMTALDYLPSNLGFPMKVVRYSPMGTKTVAWNTLSSQRTEIPEKFSIPKGYAPVDNELALFVGGTGVGIPEGASVGAAFGQGAHLHKRESIVIAPRWAPGMEGDDDETTLNPAAQAPRMGTPSRTSEWAPGF
jgi:hypothetical protein